MSKNIRDPKSSGFEDPIKCITIFSAQTLIEICTSENEYQQAQISCLSALDVTAKEFHFHRTCYCKLASHLTLVILTLKPRKNVLMI